MNFRRYYVPGATVFITQVVERREPIFSDTRFVELLRLTLRNVKAIHPFRMTAYVFLPDHFHLLFSPTASSNFSHILHSLKRNFTLEYKKMTGIPGPLRFWQKRFWDHIIRDERDFAAHLDYIHYNPVSHGYVARPEDWVHSSYSVWQEKGTYPDRWGWALPDSLSDLHVDE